MMEEGKQKKFTVQGRDTPVPVGAVGGSAGHARPSSSVCKAPAVGNQAAVQETATGIRSEAELGIKLADTSRISQFQIDESDQDDANPFERRSSIRRTPPSSTTEVQSPNPILQGLTVDRERFAGRKGSSSSVLSTEKSEEEADVDMDCCFSASQANKRKRQDTSAVSIGRSVQAEAFSKALDMTFKQIDLLAEVLKSAYKPKKEIVDVSKKLALQAKQLRTYGGWLKNATSDDEVRTERKDAEDGFSKKLTSTIGTQVTEGDLDREMQVEKQMLVTKIRNVLSEDRGWNELTDICQEEWPDEVFEKTKIGGTDMSLLTGEGDIAIIADPQEVKPDKMVGALEFKFPTLPHLIKQSSDEVDFIVNKLKTVDKGGGETEEVRVVFFVPWGLSSDGTKNDEDLYLKLQKLKENMMVHPTKRLTVVPNGVVNVEQLRKLAECVFHRTNVEIIIVGTTQHKKIKQSSKANTGRIIVKSQDKSYADLLKDIKTNVDVDKLGVKIKNIGKTGKGDLMFEIDGQRKEANILLDEIKKKVAVASEVKIHSSESLIHINDIDPAMDTKEVMEDIVNIVGPSKRQLIEVRFLRVNANGSQTAMVATQDKDLAEKLIKMGRIRIGWVNCRVRKWVRLERCFRCQQYGHRTNDCKGADRKGVCRKCGSNSHIEKECTEKPFCLTCNSEGHSNNQSKCPAYRKLMRQKVQGLKKNGRRSSTGSTRAQ